MATVHRIRIWQLQIKLNRTDSRIELENLPAEQPKNVGQGLPPPCQQYGRTSTSNEEFAPCKADPATHKRTTAHNGNGTMIREK